MPIDLPERPESLVQFGKLVRCDECGWERRIELERGELIRVADAEVIDISGMGYPPVNKDTNVCPECGSALKKRDIARSVVCAEGCGWRGVETDCPEREVWSGRGKPGPRMAKRCPECGGGIKGEGVAKVHSVEVGGG